MKKYLISTIAVMALASSAQALAHAHLKSATPAEGAQVSAPQELRLTFTEGLELPFSGVEVVSTDGDSVSLDDARLQDDGKTLVAPVDETLESGSYDVHWHVLSVDGHKTQGQYRFDVTP